MSKSLARTQGADTVVSTDTRPGWVMAVDAAASERTWTEEVAAEVKAAAPQASLEKVEASVREITAQLATVTDARDWITYGMVRGIYAARAHGGQTVASVADTFGLPRNATAIVERYAIAGALSTVAQGPREDLTGEAIAHPERADALACLAIAQGSGLVRTVKGKAAQGAVKAADTTLVQYAPIYASHVAQANAGGTLTPEQIRSRMRALDAKVNPDGLSATEFFAATGGRKGTSGRAYAARILAGKADPVRRAITTGATGETSEAAKDAEAREAADSISEAVEHADATEAQASSETPDATPDAPSEAQTRKPRTAGDATPEAPRQANGNIVTGAAIAMAALAKARDSLYSRDGNGNLTLTTEAREDARNLANETLPILDMLARAYGFRMVKLAD